MGGTIDAYPLTLTGVSFRTLDVGGREVLAAEAKEPGSLARSLVSEGLVQEAAVISTCNRFEVVAVGRQGAEEILTFFKRLLGSRYSPKMIYQYSGSQAVRHLFRVTSSLDSMVLGEQQILGQVKQAYRQAVDSGCVGAYLHHLFQSAFSIAKRIRTNTGVSQHGVSISYVAVRLAQQIFDDLSERSVLIVGSGQMAELAVLHLCTHGCRRIVVANRTLARAAELADRFGGSAVSLDDMNEALRTADIVIGSIAIDRAILEVETVRRLKRTEPLFLIDLGVPRNFSPNLANLDSVYLYNIDDLSTIADQNKGLREEALKEAEIIVEYGMHQYERWRRRVLAQPELIDLRAKVRSVCESELRDALRGIVSEDQLDRSLGQLSHRISQKLSHQLTRYVVREEGGGLEEDGIPGLLIVPVTEETQD